MDIVVVGDVLLDRDLRGGARRLSPDAPVPVVEIETEDHRAGGAGLVATLLARDGHRVRLVTVLGDDTAAGQLRRELAGVEVVAGPSGAPTPVKTRIRAHGQAVVRFDEGCGEFPPPEATAGMLAAVASAEVVIVADYGRGLAANGRLRELLQ
ncbi:PfkB family carbohydrate kinase, partial [Arthrobacter sp. GCM10027362]|uniref:PfkB family carbohydrate kinase n=1 Tax=Arthrobacter sp. GCM10027362 TaxID=3273379 RepID=UPI00362D610F